MCTHIRLECDDGSVVTGRTMEGAFEMYSDLAFIPRGMTTAGLTPSGKPGHTWKNRYASVGVSAYGALGLVDGVNERGLAAGMFFFPGTVGYQDMPSGAEASTLGPSDVVDYLLGTCATVDDAATAIRDVIVAEVAFPGTPVFPLHFPVVDATGKCIVIEHVGGEVRVHDNPVGVCTNSPELDWHLDNLRHFVGLRPQDAGSRSFMGMVIDGFGNGTGMLGLPGDYTPESRFVRAAAFADAAPRPATSVDAVDRAFHILNLFDIPVGAVVGAGEGNSGVEHTSFTSVRDQAALKYYVSSEECRALAMLDLNQIDLSSATSVLRTPFLKQQSITDVTIDLTPVRSTS